MTSESTSSPPGEPGPPAEALDADPFLTATPEDVAADLAHAFTHARVAVGRSLPGELVTRFPGRATEAAMNMVRPVLEAKDAEIRRLREQVESARADERQKCVERMYELSAEADCLDVRMDGAFALAMAAGELEAGVSAPAVDTREADGK